MLKTFRATFRGRQLGSIDMFYLISVDIQAENEEQAREKLYYRYEILHDLRITQKADTNV